MDVTSSSSLSRSKMSARSHDMTDDDDEVVANVQLVPMYV